MKAKDPFFPMGEPQPQYRRLRAYSFDPSLDTQMETAVINQVTLNVPWENLELGPKGEYLEVVDYDPASESLYAPVNLDDPALLAQDGLAPSEGTPQFHQQMAYAVVSNTIQHFERALGRRALWARRRRTKPGESEFVQRLRIYPHALREANAYYSPDKKSLLFGYFPASAEDPGKALPGGMVFTCLSFDIVAHETTHALLDGLHPKFIDDTNPDVPAFHEAFADIVALFQHFSFPEVLRHQIAKTRGDLRSQNLLAQLAQQFGQAIGTYGALRDALGSVDPETLEWKHKEPDPSELDREMEPHSRGAILVAAVFDAFLSIYKSRVADLLRIASNGTGILQPGELHPDLVNRLADEAAKSAEHVLRICIRALDYCPPVDITFGEYLRALITADFDLVPDDKRKYRIAFIEAFRRRGIYPRNVRTLSEESLRWRAPETDALDGLFEDQLKRILENWDMNANREEIFNQTAAKRAELNRVLRPAIGFNTANEERRNEMLEHLGLLPGRDRRLEVHSIRPCRRIGPNGEFLRELVVELVQTVDVKLPPPDGDGGDGEPKKLPTLKQRAANDREQPEGSFKFRGGSTLLVNMTTGKVRYCIIKDTASQTRRRRQADYISGAGGSSLSAMYFGQDFDEPFAMLHRNGEVAP